MVPRQAFAIVVKMKKKSENLPFVSHAVVPNFQTMVLPLYMATDIIIHPHENAIEVPQWRSSFSEMSSIPLERFQCDRLKSRSATMPDYFIQLDNKSENALARVDDFSYGNWIYIRSVPTIEPWTTLYSSAYPCDAP